MEPEEPILSVRFFRLASGREPVREFLKSGARENRRIIGEDLKTVQFGWPLGMPLVRKVEAGLWEIRSRVQDGIVRVLFTIDGRQIVLLHAFIKKSQKMPKPDLELAKTRLRQVL